MNKVVSLKALPVRRHHVRARLPSRRCPLAVLSHYGPAALVDPIACRAA